MRIAVDAMGGDDAPREIVAGAIRAVRELSGISRLYLVGNRNAVQAEIDAAPGSIPKAIELVAAEQVVGMDESPAAAIRRKKDSSISRAVDLVKEGKADAVFSAGNTGAAVAATTLKLRTLAGVSRPGIATVFPSKKGAFVLIDAGANIDCSAELLVQFAVMGSLYSREILGVANPRVGLLNIGGEQAKGNDATKKAYSLLEKSHLQFFGNAEGRDLFDGRVDVVVCDGFVGNVFLKTTESVASAFGSWLKDELMRTTIRKLGAILSRGAFKDLKARADPARYGGAPLLGVNGICIIGHGSSTAEAVLNAVRVASEEVAHNINHLIVNEMKLIGEEA